MLCPILLVGSGRARVNMYIREPGEENTDNGKDEERRAGKS